MSPASTESRASEKIDVSRGDRIRVGGGLGWEVTGVGSDGTITAQSTGNGPTGRRVRKVFKPGTSDYSKITVTPKSTSAQPQTVKSLAKPETPEARAALQAGFSSALKPADVQRSMAMNDRFRSQYGIGFYRVRRHTSGASVEDDVGASVDQDSVLNISKQLGNAALLRRLQKQGELAVGTLEGLLTHEFFHYAVHWHNLHGRTADATLQAKTAARAAGRQVKESPSTYGEENWREWEAETFALYHWGGSRRPAWVVAWGKTFHDRLGLDPTPMSERR